MRSWEPQNFGRESHGTSENLEREGKFQEYQQDSEPQINQNISPIFHYIAFKEIYHAESLKFKMQWNK